MMIRGRDALLGWPGEETACFPDPLGSQHGLDIFAALHFFKALEPVLQCGDVADYRVEIDLAR